MAVFLITAIVMMLLMGGGYAVYSVTEKRRRRRIVEVIGGQAPAGKTAQSAKEAAEQRRTRLAQKLKESTEEEKAEKKGTKLPELFMRAGWKVGVKQFYLYSFLFAALVTAGLVLWGKSPFVVIAGGFTAFLGLPRLFLKRAIQRRQKLFLADLADMLESVTRLIKAGMPVSEAVRMISREFTGPVGEEMEIVYEQQRVGVSLADAMAACAERMPLTEMYMLATAVNIQAQTGSSLSEVLENLARMVRGRFKLKRKIQTLSSEAKSSAMIIGALPIFVASAMYLINPDYVGILFTTGTGKVFLFGAITWMGVGILVMRAMINFKV